MLIVTVLAVSLLGAGEDIPPNSILGRAQESFTVGRDAYVSCVESAAGRLEASQEPATTIADAALQSCLAERQRLIDAMAEFGHLKTGINRESSRRNSTEVVLERVQPALRSKAILVVTERRAARARR